MGEVRLTVVEISARNVPGVWRGIRYLVQSALKRAPGWEEADLIDALLSGEMALWLLYNGGENPSAILVLRLVQWPQYSILELFLAGAEPGFDIETALTDRTLLDRLQEEADRLGARYVQAWMRPGLARLAKRVGWRKECDLMVLKCEDS